MLAEIPHLPSRKYGSVRPSQRKNDTLAKIQGIVDPQNKHSLQKLLATMTWLGLKPEDLDPSKDEEVEVSHKVPDAEKARKIGNERSEVWEGLKRARLTEVQKRLQFLSDDDARRVLKVKLGEGVRPVLEEDLPPVECLDGMADFEAMRDKAFQKIKDEQQRKAALLASGFLMEKKRLDEADQKIAALEQRLKEYKKAQADAIAERKKENEKAQEMRRNNVKKAAEARARWEDDTYDDLMSRIDKARATRTKMYSKEGLKDTIEEGRRKRQRCFDQALEREAALLASIEEANRTAEERLQARREEIEAECERKAEESRVKFQERQIRIYVHTEEWVDKKLQDHAKFKARYDNSIQAGQDFMKARSKSAGDLCKQAEAKWKGNYARICAQREQNNSDLLARQEAARQRSEARAALKLKCANDIHSFREVKYKTWGELQKRRWEEIQRSRDAQTQALVFKIAEGQAKAKAQEKGRAEVAYQRQRIGADSLALNDRAKEGFIRIKAEPDERKIVKVMSELGFSMPKLADEASYWRHLIEDTSRGRKVRRHIEYEVTLREDPKDPNGARIHDTRNHGCVVEMLGKKKWVAHQHHDPLVARWPTGDPKLYHLSQQRILPEPDEENRELRKHKQPRTDVNIPESRSPLRRRDHDHDSTAF
ncbi:Uncharacterized protein SCF082_LOCUS50305 [Durusdinium trenchii]|uniref:Trichohyalin-plectin-homology domain-containing protein n=1 Tax=Durusdinium trenchii TaxID=1381693 RepID=A0ABP0S736_9DINO